MKVQAYGNETDFRFICNSCQIIMTMTTTRVHCKDSQEDYDLCFNCFEKYGQCHKSSSLKWFPELKSESEVARWFSIVSCIRILRHVINCKLSSCGLLSCIRMKRIISHIKVCEHKNFGSCKLCKQLIALCCCHSKNCPISPDKEKCDIPFCTRMKFKILKKQLQTKTESKLTQAVHDPVENKMVVTKFSFLENNNKNSTVSSSFIESLSIPKPNLRVFIPGSIGSLREMMVPTMASLKRDLIQAKVRIVELEKEKAEITEFWKKKLKEVEEQMEHANSHSYDKINLRNRLTFVTTKGSDQIPKSEVEENKKKLTAIENKRRKKQ